MTNSMPRIKVASWRTQMRVIHALTMREIITRYGRHNIGFLWLFVEPLMFTLGVIALWSMMKGNESGHFDTIPMAAFAVTGYSSVLMWRNMSSRCIKAIEPNLSLMYHRNVKVLDVFLARCLLEIAGATASFVLLSLALIFVGIAPWPENTLMIIGAWGMLILFSLGLSLCIGAVSERSEVIARVWHVCTYLLFPLSGAMFMIEWLPESMRATALMLPMVHITEMLRHGYYGAAITTHEDPAYLLIWCIGLLLLGLALTREAGRRVTLA